MARAKSEFVSSLGSGFEFVKAISDRVRELGGNDDDLRRVMAEPALCQRIAEAIMGREKRPSGDGFTVTVDYSKSLAEMIAAGNYD